MLNEKSTLFKAFLSDVGLLTTIYGKACKLQIVSKGMDINKGAIYENDPIGFVDISVDRFRL